MTDNNLAIWNALERTDPKHVKPITGKTYQGNSPRPQYVIWKLTEMFGPVGQGFGWLVDEDRYVDGIPHPDGTEKLHECRIRFWWRVPGEVEPDTLDARSMTVDSYGCTKALYKAGTKGGNPGYWVSDEDAAKKSLTDAIVKAASWLGVAGDIFMGRWDDSKYQAELREAFSKPKPLIGPDNQPVIRSAPKRPAEPPHDPETGEVLDERNPPPATPEKPVRDDGATIREAFEDGIRDSLPENHTPREFYRACATAMEAQFRAYKTIDGLRAGFAKYWRLLGEIEANEPELHVALLVVKDETEKAIAAAGPRQMLSKRMGEEIMFAIGCCDSEAALDRYADELGESDGAFALDHPKIKAAFDARRRVLAEAMILGERRVV